MGSSVIDWERITEAARELGAGDWAMRKWAQRNKVPPQWQIDIGEKLNVEPSMIKPPSPTPQGEANNG